MIDQLLAILAKNFRILAKNKFSTSVILLGPGMFAFDLPL